MKDCRVVSTVRNTNGEEKKAKTIGLVRDLNPGPLAPKARIIPLDQRAMDINVSRQY